VTKLSVITKKKKTIGIILKMPLNVKVYLFQVLQNY